MKIERPNSNIQSFAINSTKRTIFGSTSQSDDLSDNLNDSFNVGWDIVPVGSNPTVQDFNGAMFTLGQLSAYLYQIGVGEWVAQQEYYNGSIVNVGGVLYRSLVDNNTNNNPESSTEWELLVKVYSVNGKTGDITITAADLGSISQVDADNRYLQLINAPDFTIIYPNGNEASPGVLGASMRWIVENPFNNNRVECQLEVFVNGMWGNPGSYTSSGARYGALASVVDNLIIIQSLTEGVCGRSVLSGNPFGYDANTISAPVRVKIWRIVS